MLKRTFYAEPRDQTRQQTRKRESADLEVTTTLLIPLINLRLEPQETRSFN